MKMVWLCIRLWCEVFVIFWAVFSVSYWCFYYKNILPLLYVLMVFSCAAVEISVFLSFFFFVGGAQLGVWIPGSGSWKSQLTRRYQPRRKIGTNTVLYSRVGGGERTSFFLACRAYYLISQSIEILKKWKGSSMSTKVLSHPSFLYTLPGKHLNKNWV